MKKLILKNLHAEQLNKAQLKKVYGGSGCSEYYCENVNPDATCCDSGDPGGGGTVDPGGPGSGGTTCSFFYCQFVNPAALCCRP